MYAIPSAVVTPPDSLSNASLLSAQPGGFAFMMHVHAWGSWVFELNGSVTNASGYTWTQFGKGGQQEARGNGGNGGGAFYLSHRRELLDNAGEWFQDVTTDTLYVATASYSKWMPSFVCCCSFIVTSTFTMPVPCAGAMQ